MIRRLGLALCAVLLPAWLGAAGPGQEGGVFTFKAYGADQGLTNLATTVLAQDATGFMWVGTQDGLFRYDGQAFLKFGPKEGLPQGNVQALAPLPDGGLWVLTTSGLARFTGTGFQAFGPRQGLPDAALFDLAADAQGQVWVASAEGLYTGGAKGFAPAPGLPKALAGSVWADRGAPVVLSLLNNGRLFRRRADGHWENMLLPEAYRHRMPDSILQDHQARVWLRGRDWLLRVDDFAAAKVEDLSPKLPGSALQTGYLSVDGEGRVWVPTDAGAACFEGEQMWVLDEARGLPEHWAGYTMVDREGSLWVGSEGVHRVQGRLLWSAATRKQGLPADTVWNVRRTRDGVVWAATQRGLARLENGAWKAVPDFAGQIVNSLAEDSEGGLWVGGGSQDLTKQPLLMHRSARQQGFTPVPMPSLRHGDSVSSLAPDEAGGVWVGTLASGLHHLIPQGGGFRSEGVPLPGGSGGEQINQLLSAGGALWVAGFDGLLCCDKGVWRRFGTREGLKEPNVQSMAFSPRGELWLAYWNAHGLTRLDKAGGAWHVTTQVDGPRELVEDSVASLDFDAAGRLWIGSSQGVKLWDGRRCERFGRGEGLPGEDANGQAVWADADGSMWFGLSTGLAHYEGATRPDPPMAPTVRITEVKDGQGRVLGGAPEVAYRDRTLDLNFSVLSYLNENRVRLQVRLAGFEDAWRETKVREARFTALPPGDYRFEVRAQSAAGDFGPVASFGFRILPPWWERWWFLALCFAAAALLARLVWRRRTQVLRRRNEQLEAIVHARTAALEALNQRLEEASMVDALTGLKNRRYLAMNLPEEEARVLRAYRAPQTQGPLPGEDLILLLVDLDHFKEINDHYGHASGDAVLRQAAEVLRRACREADTVARWGGEEFLVVARRSDRGSADLIARNLLEAMRSHPFDLGHGLTARRTCSLGFAVYPLLPADPDAFAWEDALELADQCLYAAKRSGRDGWVGVFSTAGVVDSGLRPRLLSDLPSLVGEGRVELRTSFDEARIAWKEGHG